jgi:hypothetical protein
VGRNEERLKKPKKKCENGEKKCEISSSHGGEYDVQSCLLGYNNFTRHYIPEDNSEHGEKKCLIFSNKNVNTRTASRIKGRNTMRRC